MCRLCTSSAPLASRRRFLGQLAAGLAASSLSLWPSRIQAAVPTVGWARLVTPSRYWNLHGEQDPIVARYIQRETHLGMEPRAYSVDPGSLEQLSGFPFLFTNDLTAITDPRALANVREYLQRGGFLYIDGCVDHRLTRDFGTFLAEHGALFGSLVPGCELRQLMPTHPIFRSYAPVKEVQLGLEPAGGPDRRWARAPQALYGIQVKDRLAAVVSLDHLFCEWLTKPEKVAFCLKEIANIYVYAMTR
ncbi:MAG TPA: DUF4159 domain-containing protein [Opitutaceae bacterium]|nr:DUF4159 domain-containing protein [Opitutaceae bacterium]